MSVQPLSARIDCTRRASAKPNCPGASARRAGRFGRSGAAARSAVVMNRFSAGLRQAMKHNVASLRCSVTQVRKRPDRIGEEHHAEARHDHVEARGLERVSLRIRADELRRHAFLFGQHASRIDHLLRDVDTDASAVCAEQPRNSLASCCRCRNRHRARAARHWRKPPRRAHLRTVAMSDRATLALRPMRSRRCRSRASPARPFSVQLPRSPPRLALSACLLYGMTALCHFKSA